MRRFRFILAVLLPISLLGVLAIGSVTSAPASTQRYAPGYAPNGGFAGPGAVRSEARQYSSWYAPHGGFAGPAQLGR